MTERLTKAGYEQTQRKLANLQRRLKDIESRSDLKPEHRSEVVRSYRKMIQQYATELKVFEAGQRASRL
jgi:hypothetical protein